MNYLSLIFIILCSVAHASTAEPLGRWAKQDLKICWLDQGEFDLSLFDEETVSSLSRLLPFQVTISNDLKNFIQTNIQREFTPERTGLHFVGWKSCALTDQADVKIVTGNKDLAGYGMAKHGRISHVKDDEEYEFLKGHSFIYFDMGEIGAKLESPWDVYLTVLHELGHVAGLRHEHIREEAAADPACKSLGIGPNQETPFKYTVNLSPYDPTSIMNYCFTGVTSLKTGPKFIAFDGTQPISGKVRSSYIQHWTDESIVSRVQRDDGMYDVTVRVGLSRGDVAGIKCLYKTTEEKFYLSPTSCEE